MPAKMPFLVAIIVLLTGCAYKKPTAQPPIKIKTTHQSDASEIPLDDIPIEQQLIPPLEKLALSTKGQAIQLTYKPVDTFSGYFIRADYTDDLYAYTKKIPVRAEPDKEHSKLWIGPFSSLQEAISVYGKLSNNDFFDGVIIK